MKFITITLFSLIISVCHSQSRNDFFMDYRTYGLGSNNGDSLLIFSVQNNHLKIRLFTAHALSDFDATNDTIGMEYYIFEDSILIRKDLNIPLRISTIDSIEMYLKLPNRKRINTNFCVKSGSVHIIRIKSDSIRDQSFRLYNTFDSTALQITDLLFNYLPENVGDFRPLKMWELDKKCDERIKERRPEDDLKEPPANRMDLIEETIRKELKE